ncbi:unnamed protein product [Trichobilharzia szidati]|nr:unnamed protein product [Trichobilharzia szidati]CAH8867505.1 unnamed protein product [Trichobilharzia szidati]
MPVSSLLAVCRIIQSTAIRKIIGDSRQPASLSYSCPHFEGFCKFPVVDYLACSIVVQLLDEMYNCRWHPVVTKYLPKQLSIDTVCRRPFQSR